jgi:hypothetical protein
MNAHVDILGKQEAHLKPNTRNVHRETKNKLQSMLQQVSDAGHM